MSAELRGRCIQIRGTVQGVGFRPFVYRLAVRLGVLGRVFNQASGVTIEAFADDATLDRLVELLHKEAPPAARIEHLVSSTIPVSASQGFEIVASEQGVERRAAIPADLATCPDCLAEIFDPGARRYRYAFTNCTNCGPRFSIAQSVPYDRATTTMSVFRMCGDCRREYEDPADRRFHAVPIACPRCGPRLSLVDRAGVELPAEDPLLELARLLSEGAIAAIKGLGGFHLACDATRSLPVAELRQRKRRDHKPFAVMVPDLAGAEALAELGPVEREVIGSRRSPIVLARARGLGLAPEVSPDTHFVGLMLPYTPLHHLLLAAAKRPLVMTSGNRSEEPIAYENEDALARLGDIADVFLLHDRPIQTRTDDSVVAVIDGRPSVWRRSRGFVPEPITLPVSLPEPILAVGGHLKNTFCIAVGDVAYLGPHIGDLENLETHESFVSSLTRLESFLGIHPILVAHDLHPGYLSTRFAETRSGRRIGVQHHHAHVASAMAEHGLADPVIGVAFDGTGYGPDGALWGGEIMVADLAGYQRRATLRPIHLAGGDKAVRDAWRVALALLDDAFEGQPPLRDLALFREVDPAEVAVVRRMLAARLNTVPAHGAGRYFDAFAALGLARPRAFHEGQLAMAWEQVADPQALPAFGYALAKEGAPWQIDLRPAVREAVRALIDGAAAATVSARFHQTLVQSTVEVAEALAFDSGARAVVLTGGCFQNRRLAEGLKRGLASRLPVFLHERVPPGDGGLALGQAVVAGARAAKLGA